MPGIQELLQQYGYGDTGGQPNLQDILEQAGYGDIDEDLRRLMPEYQQEREQFALDQYQTRSQSLMDQLANIGTQRGFARESFQQNIGQARQGTQQRLMDLLGQQQSVAGESGFAQSGAVQRASERNRGRLIDQFSTQREGLQSQLSQQLNTLSLQETGLEGKQNLLGSQFAEDIFEFRGDYEQQIYDRLIDLINSQALGVDDQDSGTPGVDPFQPEPDETKPGETEPDETKPGEITPPDNAGATFNYGDLAGVDVSNWSANDWVNWYANWYAENNDGITLSVLPDANSWSAGDWMGWYESQFGNPNPFG